MEVRKSWDQLFSCKSYESRAARVIHSSCLLSLYTVLSFLYFRCTWVKSENSLERNVTLRSLQKLCAELCRCAHAFGLYTVQYVVFALFSLHLSELALFLHSYGFEETPSSKVFSRMNSAWFLREESGTWKCVCLLLSEYRGSFRAWILVCKGLRAGPQWFMHSVESHRRHHLVPTSPCIGHSAVLHSLLTDVALPCMLRLPCCCGDDSWRPGRLKWVRRFANEASLKLAPHAL